MVRGSNKGDARGSAACNGGGAEKREELESDEEVRISIYCVV